MERFKLNESEAAQLVDEPELAAVFEDALGSLRKAPPRMAATWLCGEVTAWLGQNGKTLNETGLKGADLADLLDLASDGTINLTTAKSVLNSMLAEGLSAAEIVERDGLRQQSDDQAIREMVCAVLNEFSDEVQKFRAGKASVANWLYGQVMRRSGGRANPGIVKTVLEDELK